MLRIFLTVSCCALFSAGCDTIRFTDPNAIYVAFGDSATDGPADRDYPDILRDRLALPVESFAKEGKDGETTSDGITRLEGLLAAEIFPSAEVLLYWQGGADLVDFIREVDPFLLFSPDDVDYPLSPQLESFLDDVQDNIQTALTAGREAGLNVFVATYFPIREDASLCDASPFGFLLPAQARRANSYTEVLNERIRNAATTARATLVDVATEGNAITASSDNYFNCNHLSSAGNAIVADVFENALQDAGR